MSPRRDVLPSCWFHIQTTSCTNHGCLFLCFVPPEVAAGHSVVVEVSPDIHICGFCKQQYNNFEVFLAHKQNGCSLPSSDTSATSATTVLTGKNTIYCCKPACKKKMDLQSCTDYTSSFLSCTDSSAEFVFEETYQTCVMRGVKKILTKAQKTPSKKLKPSLTSKRHTCCFSGRCLSPFYDF